ncbi:ribonuclease H family protein [Priestia megaterium]|uniref:ribonuclease H n=1 Tax=Priestia megaterium TaxID=1404 RepID=A0A6M6DZ87_PRIMG|nr:ribonuclease H family protein [Priestia megaterium]QJX79920.1 reverse transcriptase-like protein [Priestia megaterium]
MDFKPYYAVKIGRNLGIFKEWKEVVAETEGFFGGSYKKCASKQEALDFLDLKDEKKKSVLEVKQTNFLSKNPNVLNVYVDGSYDQNEKIYAYAFAVVEDGGVTDNFSGAKQDVNVGELLNSSSGELLAAMMAIKYSIHRKIRNVIIYYDCIFIPNLLNGTAEPRNEYQIKYIEFMRNAITTNNLKVNFTKVQAHSSNEYNKFVDKLANKAMRDKREEIIKNRNNKDKKTKKTKKNSIEPTSERKKMLLATISHNAYFKFRASCNSVKDMEKRLELVVNNIMQAAKKHNIEIDAITTKGYLCANLDKMEKSYKRLKLKNDHKQLVMSMITNLYFKYRDKLKSSVKVKKELPAMSKLIMDKAVNRGVNITEEEIILLYKSRLEKLDNTYNKTIKKRSSAN